MEYSKNMKLQAGGKYQDKSKWTESRRADFDFYESVLGGIASKEKSLLDVGCGNGQFRDLFFKFDYYGFDVRASDIAKEKTLLEGDFTKTWPIPFSTVLKTANVGVSTAETKMTQHDSFDVVMLSNVLEHTPDPVLMVNEAFRVLKAGGMVVGSVPFYAEVHEEPYDFMRFTYFALEDLFKKAGFTSIKIVPLGTPFGDYRWSQEKLIKQIERTKVKSVKGKIARKVFIRLARTVLNFFERKIEQPNQSLKYARRYGFTAQKLNG